MPREKRKETDELKHDSPDPDHVMLLTDKLQDITASYEKAKKEKSRLKKVCAM